jgi:hypothetical protein
MRKYFWKEDNFEVLLNKNKKIEKKKGKNRFLK